MVTSAGTDEEIDVEDKLEEELLMNKVAMANNASMDTKCLNIYAV